MRLIAALSAGIRGAEDGTFEVYRRGTSTEISVYADFEGETLLTDLTLDGNGGCEAYVAETATVRVYDSTGTLVREFTEGNRADAIEVVSTAFTGADYDDAQTGISKPVTLATILNLWKTQNGATAIDWKVLAGGVLDTLPNHLGGLVGVVVNVKAPAYRAAGNGSTNDAVAIQGAIDAAVNGGIVFFPPGDYYVGSSTLVLAAASRCVLMGAGAGASRIVADGTGAVINVARTAANQRGALTIQGLAVQNNASGTNYLLYGTGTGYDLVVRDCHFGSPAYGAGTNIYVAVAAATMRLTITGCTFDLYSAAQTAIHVVAASGHSLTISDNHFTYVAGAHTAPCIRTNSGKIIGNTFDVAAASSGTLTLINDLATQAAGDCLVVVGNRCTNNNGSTVRALVVNDPGLLVEFGNSWSDAEIAVASTTALTGDLYACFLGAREGRSYAATEDAEITITLNPNIYSSFTITRSTGTDITATLTPPIYPGMTATMTWRNTHAATAYNVLAGATAWTGASIDVEGWAHIHAQYSFTIHLRSIEKAAGGYTWVATGCSMSPIADL